MSFMDWDFPGGVRRFYYREGTSDPNMMRQAFVDHAFDLSGLRLWPKIEAFYEKCAAPLIIDAGANIGTSAVAYATTFPKAKVVALEPEDTNFKLLEKNTDGLNVHARHIALASRPGYVEVYHPKGEPIEGHGHAGFRTRQDVDGVRATSVDLILQGFADRTPFIIKIDIEGAEADVFSGALSWMSRFPVLVIEPHDYLFPGEHLSRSFLRAIAPMGRDFVISGEHIISIDTEMLK